MQIQAKARPGSYAGLNEIVNMVGNTPLRHFPQLSSAGSIFAKLEWMQIGKSVKARAAFNIIYQAWNDGKFRNGEELLDASSGNTAIAYGSIAKLIGLPVTIILPENASGQRKEILSGLGVNLIYSSPFEGTDGAQEVAKKMAEENPDAYFYADQYSNNANWKAHYHGTGREIIDQTQGAITHFVSGLGTTGTFTGTGKKLREFNPDIKMIGLQPNSPLHGLEGWKHLETAKVPGIYDGSIADEIIEIDSLAAFDMIKRVAQKSGLLLSPSSAANLVGAKIVADKYPGSKVVTILPDTIEKYKEVRKEIFGA
jgi:cysteine synthase B